MVASHDAPARESVHDMRAAKATYEGFLGLLKVGAGVALLLAFFVVCLLAR